MFRTLGPPLYCEPEETIDTDILIPAIERHPVLWDKTLDTYKCRSTTANTWNEVCAEVNPRFVEMDARDRNHYVKSVMRKWKNIRDAWLRALKKHAEALRSGVGANSRRKFIYREEMRFLERVLYSRSADAYACLELEGEGDFAMSSTSFAGSPSPRATTSDSEDAVSGQKKRPREVPVGLDLATLPRKKAKVELDAQMMDQKGHAGLNLSTKPETKENRHMSFFKSILPSLQQLSEEQILEFQVGAICLLQKVRKRGPIPFPASASHPHLQLHPALMDSGSTH